MRLNTFLAAVPLIGSALAVNPADISGLSFVDSKTKARLQIVGVDYQPGGQAGFDEKTGHDVLSDPDACLRDAVLLQKLGANTIRVYNVNPQTNHDKCMSIFNAAGIYVIIDVNSPTWSINRAEPWTSYYDKYLEYIFGNVENFKGYPNTLAFFAGNEIINDLPTAKENPRYMRAVQRDLRQYIKKHSARHIPVGYSAADVREVLQDTWAYVGCAINGSSTDDSRAEWFGLNSYSWCGKDATYETAGFDVLTAMFKDSSIPIVFSEYGCNKPAGLPRPFNEVQALYGPKMTGINGGLVYEYSQEESDYGLLVINKDGTIKLKGDYENLQAQYNKIDPKLQTVAITTQNPIPKCDASLIKNSEFGNTFNIPVLPPNGQGLIDNGLPNPQRGKLVDVTDLNVKQKVYNSAGKEITGLSLKKIDSPNVPGGANFGTGSSGSSSNSTSGTKKNSASGLEFGKQHLAIGGALAAAVAWF